MQEDFNLLIDDFRSRNLPVIIELGPGNEKIHKNSIGLDCLEKPSVDFICDLSSGMKFIPDSSVELIYSRHFLEHIDDIDMFLKEVHRVLKPGGKMISVVPHFSNPYYYSDPTHKSFWGLYTLMYYSNDKFFKRDVPRYYNSIDFKVNSIFLNFNSPFRIINFFKKMMTRIVNSHKNIMELYEENLTGIFPCYEMKFEIEKR